MIYFQLKRETVTDANWKPLPQISEYHLVIDLKSI